jgi:hypothetical protein
MDAAGSRGAWGAGEVGGGKEALTMFGNGVNRYQLLPTFCRAARSC